MSDQVAAEVFPAGEILADELEARDWTQMEFAEILGRPTQFVSEIISGKKEITRESAAQIGAALGTPAEFWLNLQDAYLLWKQAQDADSRQALDAVKTRARLRDVAPVALLRRRGYIKSTDPDKQSQEVLKLLEMQSFDDRSSITFAARRSNGGETVTVLQRAWVACVKEAARAIQVPTYDAAAFRELARQLSGLARDPKVFALFQSMFAEVGVKLVYVESFPGGKLDGCAMMVDGNPVIGVSGRGKRLDIVLFTILHEVSHVLLGHLEDDGDAIVDDLSAEGSGVEKAADEHAAGLAIAKELPQPPERINASWVRSQSEALEVHPIVLIGRLQSDKKVSWKTTLVRNAPTVTQQLESWAAAPRG